MAHLLSPHGVVALRARGPTRLFANIYSQPAVGRFLRARKCRQAASNSSACGKKRWRALAGAAAHCGARIGRKGTSGHRVRERAGRSGSRMPREHQGAMAELRDERERQAAVSQPMLGAHSGALAFSMGARWALIAIRTGTTRGAGAGGARERMRMRRGV